MTAASVLPDWVATLLAPRPEPFPILERTGVPADDLPAPLRALLEELERSELRDDVMDAKFDVPDRPGLAGVLSNRAALMAVLCGGLHIAYGSGGHVFHAVSLGDGRVFGFDDEDAAMVLDEAPSLFAWIGEAVQNGDDAAAIEAVEGAAIEWEELEPLPPLLDPATCLPRVRWVAAALHLDLWDDANLDELIRQAPPLAQFDVERDDAERWPHIALYWLWAQFLLDDRERLMPRLETLQGHRWELVRESAQVIADLLRDGTTTVDLGHLHADAILSARATVATKTPDALARTWLQHQTGSMPAVLFALPDLAPNDALRAVVVEGLERCHRTDVAEMLARACSAWRLHEARPALEKLVHERTVFWKHAEDETSETAGMVCARALLRTSDDGDAVFDFLATELQRTEEADIPDDREQHEACVFLGPLLMLNPENETLLEAVRDRLASEVACIVDGALETEFDAVNVFSLLMPLELQRITGFEALLQPLATFDTSAWEPTERTALYWEQIRAQARRILAFGATEQS